MTRAKLRRDDGRRSGMARGISVHRPSVVSAAIERRMCRAARTRSRLPAGHLERHGMEIRWRSSSSSVAPQVRRRSAPSSCHPAAR
jgi:hypothetical protein